MPWPLCLPSKQSLRDELLAVVRFAQVPMVSINRSQELVLHQSPAFIPVHQYGPSMVPVAGEIGCTARLRFVRPLPRWKPEAAPVRVAQSNDRGPAKP